MNLQRIDPESAIKTCIGYGYMWTDSFLKCFTKQKDNSVWLLTATISPPMSEISKGEYTIVLAIGKSCQDHTAVIEHFYREFEEISNGFDCYLSDTNEIRRVAFGLLYHSADRPERQSVMHTMGEGHFGKVTGWAAPISAKLPACENCYKHIVSNLMNVESLKDSDNLKDGDLSRRTCTKCFCWDLKSNDESQEVCAVPDEYPGHTELQDILPPKGREPGRQFIGPVKLTTAWLVSTVILLMRQGASKDGTQLNSMPT